MSVFYESVYTLPAASMGPENPLPDLHAAGDRHAEIEIDTDTVTAEEARYMGWGRLNSILPYTIQDGYDRNKVKRDLKCFVLENSHLKAVFLPSLGGRMWSLYDKDRDRELLHCNPVFQPANLALRNAWFSGGVEWNCGIIGHTPYTCDDMACELLALSDGTPVLRMYAYERVRRLLYRVEAFLPDESKQLFVRVRIDNTLMQNTAVYWWSNMAVNEGEDIRVIVPADKAFRYGYGGKLSKVPIPYMDAQADKLHGSAARLARKNGGVLHWDVSRSVCLPQSMDFFFDVKKDARPFIAALDRNGFGICQTSTHELRGRKLFVWGMGEGGRHWQSFLSEPGSAYIELQSGLARTQLEHLPMKAGASVSWLEAYGPLSADGDAVHGEDWPSAVRAVSDALDLSCPEQMLEDLHAQVQQQLDEKNGTVLHESNGFALCDRALLGKSFSAAGLSLGAMHIGDAEKPWWMLIQTHELPCPDPLEAPLSYQIAPEWEKALREAVDSGISDHWYAHYHLGVMELYRDEKDKAEKEFLRSLDCRMNPWALRCLAMVRKEEAPELLCRAVALKPIRPLAVEAMEALLEAKGYDEIIRLFRELPAGLRSDGRIMAYYAAALLRSGQTDDAEKILRGPIVLTDVREGNTLLTDLWFEMEAVRRFGKADAESLTWAEENVRPPEHLEFRML